MLFGCVGPAWKPSPSTCVRRLRERVQKHTGSPMNLPPGHEAEALREVERDYGDALRSLTFNNKPQRP